jgi:hypothetical protein
MTRLWEENKPLILVVGAGLLLFFVLRPTLIGFGPPMARWMGTAWKGQYDTLEQKLVTLDEQLQPFYPPEGGRRIKDIVVGVRNSNLYLKQSFDQYVHALAFVPYRPFRPPMERLNSEWGHYFRETLTNTSDALLRYCSFRFVTMTPDLGFTEVRKGGPIPGSLVPDMLRDLAAAETFVKRCADSRIKSTQIVQHLRPEGAGTAGRQGFIREHPMQVRLQAGFPELMRLLQSLNGHHGMVKDVRINELRDTVEEVTLNLGSSRGVRRDDQFTLFKRSPDVPCKLEYAGRVVVANVSENESVATVIEGSIPFDGVDIESRDRLRIQPGDLAGTGFFRVKSIDIKSVPGRVESVDDEGIPTQVIPHMVNVEMRISTFSFDPATEHLTPENLSQIKGLKLPKTTATPTAPAQRPPSGDSPSTGTPHGGHIIRSY